MTTSTIDCRDEAELAKKTDQICVKLTGKKKAEAQAVANVLEISASEYVEMLISADLKARRREFNLLSSVFGGESNKSNGSNQG